MYLVKLVPGRLTRVEVPPPKKWDEDGNPVVTPLTRREVDRLGRLQVAHLIDAPPRGRGQDFLEGLS